MSRFFKVRITQNEFHRLDAFETFETFIIHPNKNNFDSFMTEICARLPELFYQPFKLYYEDRTRELITIFNWLDFGIFFMQNIDLVYVVKDSKKQNNFHYRTLWSMPVPTAAHLSAYQQFMTQPAHQLSEPTCFPFIGNNDPKPPGEFLLNPNQNAQQFANTQVNADANTKQPDSTLQNSYVAAKLNSNVSNNKPQSNDTTVKSSVQSTVQNPVKASPKKVCPTNILNATLIANGNLIPSATTKPTLETDIKITATDTVESCNIVANGESNANGNQTISDDPVVEDDDSNSLLMALEKPIFKESEDETLKNVNNLDGDGFKIHKKKLRNRKKKQQVVSKCVEPAVFIDGHWENETFSVGDIVEVLYGDWIGLHGEVSAVNGKKVSVIGNIDGVCFDEPLIFKEKHLYKHKNSWPKIKRWSNADIKENDNVTADPNTCATSDEFNTNINQHSLDKLDVPLGEGGNLVVLMNAIDSYVEKTQKENIESQFTEEDEVQVCSETKDLPDLNENQNDDLNDNQIGDQNHRISEELEDDTSKNSNNSDDDGFIKVVKKKSRNQKKKQQIASQCVLVDDDDSENKTLSEGDIVEEIEHGKDNDILKTQTGNIGSQIIKEDDIQVCSEASEILLTNLNENQNSNQNEDGIEGDIQNAGESNRNENITVDADEIAIQKKNMEDIAYITDQNVDEPSSIDQEQSVQFDENKQKYENAMDETITIIDDGLKGNFTEKLIPTNSNPMSNSDDEKAESNEVKNGLEEVINYAHENKEICESMKLISIESTESNVEPMINKNPDIVISIEAGKESPTSRDWTFVERAEYAESPVLMNTGTIPKKTTSAENINCDTVKRRLLPAIPICSAEKARVVSHGHINEALSIMIAMGFKNDGNQLYELLESVDGNIASVLDLIDSQK